LIAFKLIEASSSLQPPERNVIPGTFGTRVLPNVQRVYHATSEGVEIVVASFPLVIMFGFNSIPSISTC
jgi:hypothetical protein